MFFVSDSCRAFFADPNLPHGATRQRLSIDRSAGTSRVYLVHVIIWSTDTVFVISDRLTVQAFLQQADAVFFPEHLRLC